MLFKFTVKNIIPENELSLLDLDNLDLIRGIHVIKAKDLDHALNRLHDRIDISILEDWVIEIEEINETLYQTNTTSHSNNTGN